MPQVPWSTLDGDRAEALIANLLYSEHPKKATRIRPSRGDYGIDVAVPNAAESDKIDVYVLDAAPRPHPPSLHPNPTAAPYCRSGVDIGYQPPRRSA